MTALYQTYQRYLEPGFTPFDPLELARRTEEIVCRGDRRKYTKFYCTGVYGTIATGYTCGCCLRCIFCWVNWSRDFPERYGVFQSPTETFYRLSRAARKAGVDQLRISGGEPTLGKSHLLGLLERVESFELPFQGIVNLMKSGASFHVAAMSADPRIVTKQERQSLLDRLGSIHLALVSNLEEEVVDPYHTTLERLRYADINIAWSEGRTR